MAEIKALIASALERRQHGSCSCFEIFKDPDQCFMYWHHNGDPETQLEYLIAECQHKCKQCQAGIHNLCYQHYYDKHPKYETNVFFCFNCFPDKAFKIPPNPAVMELMKQFENEDAKATFGEDAEQLDDIIIV